MSGLRGVLATVLIGASLALAGCGGNDSGSSNNSNNGSNNNNNNGSGNVPATGTTIGVTTGGTSSVTLTAAGSNPAAGSANIVPIIIDSGVPGSNVKAVNLPFVTLTVCTPGSTTDCQTIDHVLLDTGSTGLRLLSPALSSRLALPAYKNAAGVALGQCFQFVDGSAWGPVRTADVLLGGERLSSVPLQAVGETGFAAVPNDCPGPAENTVDTFGANGILGVSTTLQDCGSTCATAAASSIYYQCTTSACSLTTVALASQIPNPVARLSQDNNGVVVQLPAVPDSGSATVAGSLILGIGTQANNALAGAAAIMTLDANSGYLTTTYKAQALTNSFFDTGSNFFYFNDSTLPRCTSASYTRFYCPTVATDLTASATGRNNVSKSISFRIANVPTVYAANPSFAAFGDFAGITSLTNSFDWGLPFYFGRSVYTAFSGATVAGTPGPWIAF